ncbi:MAG: VWA domain-containing protein [Blastocatellia bacterium]
MKFGPLRGLLAVVLIAVFAASLLPTSYAGQPSGATQQTDSGARPRRGKNGQAASKDTPKQAEKSNGREAAAQPQQSPAAQPAPRETPSAVTTVPASPQRNGGLQTGGQESGSARRRAEPPPFDRPPVTRGGNSQTAPATSDSRPAARPTLGRPPASDSRTPPPAQPRIDSRDQSTSAGSAGAASSADDVDGAQQDRSSRQRPTLHRPSDGQAQPQRPAPATGGAGSSNAEQPPVNQPQQTDDGDVIKLESTLVNIPLLVSDRSGRYIPQLSKNDFSLYEDGTEQEIASFGSEEVPFNVALLLDVSPSVQGNIEAIQDAATAFVRQLRSQDRVMVIAFDRGVHYLTDFTSNRRELEGAIRSISTGSGTSVYEAVYDTVRRRMRGIEGRKALILFSDGEDTTSSASYDDAINVVTESDVLVYGLRYPGGGGGGNVRVDPWPRNPVPQIPIPLPWPWPRRRRWPFFRFTGGQVGMSAVAPADPQGWPRRRGGRGGDFMADITAAGGGPVYDAEKIGDLSRLASRIADELRHVYVLSYYPTNPLSNGGYRSIRVRVKNRDDIAVRHRRGYNAREASTARSH